MKMCGLCEAQLRTRLHPCSMHPCPLLLSALYSDTTRIIMVLLEHEMLILNDPLRNWLYGCFQLGSRSQPGPHPGHGHDCFRPEAAPREFNSLVSIASFSPSFYLDPGFELGTGLSF